MKRILAALALVLAGPALAQLKPQAEPPVEVMVLGTYHFANPGLDVVNAKADDPLTPQRQRELAALAEAIARFRPTRVMVEVETDGPSFDVAAYHDFTPDKLLSQRNETVQIGYRIAHRMGLASVQGIDENGGPGEPDYFPFDAVQTWARKNGKTAGLDALFAQVGAEAKAFEAAQASESIPQLLMRHNAPGRLLSGNDLYLGLLRFGDGKDQPGAELNAYWYMRNAKIFAKLQLASRPGDRVLVIYGSGHGYWLRQLAATAPGYRSVDVMPYLQDAALRAKRGGTSRQAAPNHSAV